MNVEHTKHFQGFSLLEVLVALVLLAIGMLGIANLLLVIHKSNSSNYVRQQAVQSAYDIIDRIHANRQAAINGNYVVSNLVTEGTPKLPKAPSANCETSSCSPTQLATYDTWHWLSKDVSKLPNGCGAIATAVAGVNTLVTVTVQWDDSVAQKSLGAAVAPTQFVVKSQL